MSLATIALEDGGGVDFSRLRRERRERLLAAMEERGIDVLVVGREDNLRFLSGARRLHLSGTRPFMPAGILVRDGGGVYIVSNWDDGMPDEVAPDHLIQMSVNPMNIVAGLQKIESLVGAKTLAVDFISPLYRDLFAMVAPAARITSAEGVLRAARTVKTSDEIRCLRVALGIAEASLVAAVDALEPGVTERSLLGAFRARMSALGTTTPASEGTFCVIPSGGSAPRMITSSQTVGEGDLVWMSSGVLYAGYEGSIGRTWRCSSKHDAPTPAGAASLHDRWRRVWDRVLDACQPGATGASLVDAHLAAGEPLGPLPLAYGVGLGYEGPIAGSALGREFDATRAIVADSVLCIQIYVADEAGGYFASETVHVTADGPVVLSKMSHGPLATTS